MIFRRNYNNLKASNNINVKDYKNNNWIELLCHKILKNNNKLIALKIKFKIIKI